MRVDLLSGGYAALDNFRIVASDIPGDIGDTSVPEPTSILSFLALGTLGAGASLKRKLKPSKSTEKVG
ncbi:PEP-CTERM sorting domain-containing protein [Aphanothece sacrum]|uniref:PEP-CTERM sorting domain-containing protein n=1 Tax=Aphanothece sacrum TaxID=1122 RepID=UPI003F65885D